MFDYCLLEDLICEGEGEAGSFETLWVIPAWAVISTPFPSRDPSTEPINIVAGSTSTAYKFQVGTVGYREESQNGVAGSYNNILIEGYRNKITPHHLHEIRKLKAGYYIVIHQDANGLVRCHGTKDKPLIFAWTSNTGKTGSDRAGVEWRFSGVSKDVSAVMDATIPPPNQLLLPDARLRVLSFSPCSKIFSINGSKESDGTPLDTQSTSVKLEYTFIHGPNILYKGLITPNLSAATFSNWTITEGTRVSTDFETQIVDQVTSGSGASLRMDMSTLSSTLPLPGNITIELRIKEGSLFSPPASVDVPLCEVLIDIHDETHDEMHN